MVYDTDIYLPSTLSMFSWPVDVPAYRSSCYKRGEEITCNFSPITLIEQQKQQKYRTMLTLLLYFVNK